MNRLSQSLCSEPRQQLPNVALNSLVRLTLLWATALLGACATVETVPPGPAFELAGRIAVRYQDRGFSSALRWKHDGAADEIWLTSPLGQTLAYLQSDAEGATLTGSDKKEYRASSIDSLVRSAFGWRFPVADLRFWVVGAVVPGPQPVLLERDPAQRINKLEQGDWQVAFNYATVDSQRPARLTVNGNDAEIRLVIDSLTLVQP